MISRFIIEMSEPKKTADYAKKYYSLQRQANYGKSSFIRINKIISLVGESNKVLDIGCYDGIIGSLLRKNNNQEKGTHRQTCLSSALFRSSTLC